MNEKKNERRGLGRGLSALMADVAVDANASSERDAAAGSLQHLPIEQLFPNPDQPRRSFEQGALEDLASSIREKGVLQPLIVRPRTGSSGYEIVAGERRWRAAQLAMVHEVPVIVRDYTDTEVLEVAIIENIQRADLNPVEEAAAFRSLIDRFGHTQEKVAEALGKSRSYIANAMRLLSLPEDVLALIKTGSLSAGHARALVTSDNASALAERVVSRGMTVRDVETLVRNQKQDGSTLSGQAKDRARRKSEKDADTLALEGDLSSNLGMAVQIAHQAGGESGVLSVRYNTLSDLDALCQILSGFRK